MKTLLVYRRENELIQTVRNFVDEPSAIDHYFESYAPYLDDFASYKVIDDEDIDEQHVEINSTFENIKT
jgi:hypothetical protein